MAALGIAVSVAISSAAYAQRGGTYTLDGEPPTTRASGFPGLFDSNVAERGSFVLDIPSLAVDYGLTDNMTIGTSGVMALALALGSPALYVKARYRFLTSPTIASAFTAYSGYLTNRVGSRDTTLDAYLVGVSNNTTYYFSERSYLNAFFFYLKVGANQNKEDDGEYANASFSTLLFGASYQHWLNGVLGPQATLGLSVYQNLSIDSSTVAVSENIGGVGGLASGMLFLRLTPELRLGRWLLSPSLIGYVDLGKASSSKGSSDSEKDDSGGAGVLPWINATVKW